MSKAAPSRSRSRINDRTRDVTVLAPLPGDRIAFWIRWLHEGSHSGGIWRFVVFLSGIVPTLLGITGILIWLRQRRQRKLVLAGTRHVAAKKHAPVGDAAPANSSHRRTGTLGNRRNTTRSAKRSVISTDVGNSQM